MPSKTTERVATVAELERLREMLRTAPGKAHAWKQGAENALVLWAVLMLGLVLAWQGLAWAARRLFHVQIGWASAGSLWVIAIGAAVCASYAVISSYRWVKGWRHDYRPALREDVENGRISEEQYNFIAAKRFQEPEHGGLMYFMRTEDGRVFTLYDRESQNRGVQDEDPLKSSFQPYSQLLIMRAPRTRFILNTVFSGAPLDAGALVPLAVDPKKWPEAEEYCDIPWEELNRRLGHSPA
jgi:hypothetical protein